MVDKVAEKYEKIKKIGEGTYGKVYLAKVRRSGTYVAMKVMKPQSEDEGFPMTALREIGLLKQLDHVNIISLVDVINTMKKLTLVFEFVENDFKNLLDEKQGLSTEEIKVHYY